MTKYFHLLKKTLLFQGISQEAIQHILASGCCQIKSFSAGNTIYESGQHITCIGIVLEGTIDVIYSCASGHETIISRLTSGSIFGESFACAGDINTYNDIRSITDSLVLLLDVQMLIHQNGCPMDCRRQLLENLLHSIAKANIWLNTKILLHSQKSLRDKLLTYFEILSARENSREFVLPFNREQLASFLGSERSSISRELSRMQEEGILKIDRDLVRLK